MFARVTEGEEIRRNRNTFYHDAGEKCRYRENVKRFARSISHCAHRGARSQIKNLHFSTGKIIVQTLTETIVAWISQGSSHLRVEDLLREHVCRRHRDATAFKTYWSQTFLIARCLANALALRLIAFFVVARAERANFDASLRIDSRQLLRYFRLKDSTGYIWGGRKVRR